MILYNMGCMQTKIEFECVEKKKKGRWRSIFGGDHRRTKIRSIHISDKIGVPVGEETPMLNLARKTEQTVLSQLRAEGIVPEKGTGGVSFVVDLKDETPKTPAPNDIYSTLPGAPQYSMEDCKSSTRIQHRPRLLPPLTSKSKPTGQEEHSQEYREQMAGFLKNEDLRGKGENGAIGGSQTGIGSRQKGIKGNKKEGKAGEETGKECSTRECKETVKVSDRLERAHLNRQMVEEEKKARTEMKLAKMVPRANTPSRVTTEERLERARQNREKKMDERKEKWEKKERKIEEIRKERIPKPPRTPLPNTEI